MLNHKDEMCPQPFFSRYAKNMTFVTAKQLVKLVQAVAENLDKTLPDPLESNQPLSWLRGSLDQIKLQRVEHKDNWDVQECMLPNKRKTNNSQAAVLSNVHESCCGPVWMLDVHDNRHQMQTCSHAVIVCQSISAPCAYGFEVACACDVQLMFTWRKQVDHAPYAAVTMSQSTFLTHHINNSVNATCYSAAL